MYSLEFNIHQLILSDLAASVGASKDDPADPTIDSSVDLITSNVTTRAIFTDDADESGVNAGLEQRVFMVSVLTYFSMIILSSSPVGFEGEVQYRVRRALSEHIDCSSSNYSSCLTRHSPRHSLY